MSGSGKLVIGSPIRKWAGVKGCKSNSVEGNEHKGREFMQASICSRTVHNSSNVRRVNPIIRFKLNLHDFTPACQSPPMCGDKGGMKLQSIFRTLQKSLMELWDSVSSNWYNSSNSLFAPWKFVALSLNNYVGQPRLPTKRRRVTINYSAVRSPTTFRWMALVEKQSNTAM